jgi:6,7-dimethyl-8-ribityllumazine synthase
MRRDSDQLQPAADLRVGIVVSSYHADITGKLRDGAIAAFAAAGGRDSHLTVVESPGAFELTVICTAMATAEVDAIVALGCIVAGDTEHHLYLGHAVAQGLTTLSVETGIPVAFGVLTVDSVEQAMERAGGAKGNKGEEAMSAAIAAAHVVRQLLKLKDQAS